MDKKIIIDCNCGSHHLQINNIIDEELHNAYYQEFQLAMFEYKYRKRKFIDRLVIAFKYIKSGEMFADQLALTPEEAIKLANFINENIHKNEIKTNDNCDHVFAIIPDKHKLIKQCIKCEIII